MARCLDDCYYMPLARNDRTGVSRWKVIIQTVAPKALSFLEALTEHGDRGLMFKDHSYVFVYSEAQHTLTQF